MLTSDPSITSAVMGTDRVVVDNDSHLLAFTVDHGSQLWSADSTWFDDDQLPPTFGPATIAGSTVYAGDSNGTFYAFDLANGARLWSARLPGASFTESPAVSGGLVYAPSFQDQTVYVFDRPAPRAAQGLRRRARRCARAPGAWHGVAVANGMLYTSKNVSLHSSFVEAFDATGAHELRGNAEDLHAALDRATRGRQPASAGGGERRGLRRGLGLPQWQHHRVRRRRVHRLFRRSAKVCAPLWTATTPLSPLGIAVAPGVLYASSGRRADRLRRKRRRELHGRAEGVRSTVDGPDSRRRRAWSRTAWCTSGPIRRCRRSTAAA